MDNSYNDLGQRVRKQVSGSQSSDTRYAYDEAGQLIGEYNADGSLINEVVYLGNMPVLLLRPSGVFNIETDQLDTPRAISTSGQIVAWQWDSAPFGETLANEDVDGNGVPLNFNLRFPGQVFDAETGLHYNHFRDYDPVTGRYLESDPIGLKGGVNTFAYVLGSPTGLVDGSGLWPSVWIFPLHQGVIEGQIPVSRDLLDILRRGQKYADSDTFQTGENSFRHAMRNRGQSPCEAMRLANEFVHEQFRKAWRLRRAGNMAESLFEFSIGLHTLQDATSPEHVGFEEWSDNPGWLAVGFHIAGEALFFDEDDLAPFRDFTKQSWAWYNSGGIPKNFFAGQEEQCGCN